jgi:hypothetical protein
MMRLALTAALLCFAVASTFGQAPMEDVRQSHIEGNVPAAEDFDRLLRRDLTTFFRARTDHSVQVQYRLLRDGPTQSGVAYPKYYAWVRVITGSRVVEEGAVRLAAIERKRFEITDYINAETVRSDPRSVESVFPRALVPTILKTAGSRT